MDEFVLVPKPIFEAVKQYMQQQPVVQLLAAMQQAQPYVPPEPTPEPTEEA